VLTTPGKIGASATEEVDASEQEARFPFAADDDVKLDFLSTQKSRTAILVGGQLIETQILPTVTFYADGTCTPFRVQIRTERGVAQTLAIDPWTCAPVLAATEPAR
jgi:general secretion pathway protein H